MTADDFPRDDERRDAERLRRFVDGDGGDPPAAADAEVVGLFAEATGAVRLPEAAWGRIADRPPLPRRRPPPWGAVLALAAAALLAVGALALWLRGPASLPGPTLAELDTLGSALSDHDLPPTARLAALARVDDAARARVLPRGGR